MVHPTLLKARKPVPLSTLAGMAVLTLNEQSYIGDLILQWMAGHGVVPKEHLSSNSNSALSGMVLAGLGIANLPLYFLPLSRSRQLSVIHTSPPLPIIAYRAMYRDDGPTAFHEKIARVVAECCDFSA
jgi:DNA-binding transcriptional LysR family regulator